MRKKKDIIIFASSCLVVGIVLFFTTRNYNMLPEFTVDAVESIVLRSAEDGDKKIGDVETFIKYYNQIHNVEVKTEFCDVLIPDYSLTVKLKTGDTISMNLLGKEIEIDVMDSERNLREYLGRQSNLYTLLHKGEY